MPRQVHPIQVRRAFGGDPEHTPEFAELIAIGGTTVQLRTLHGGVVHHVIVFDRERLQALVEREDVCRLTQGLPITLLSSHYRVMAVAVGPASLPDHVEVNYGIARMEDGSVVEIPSDSNTQPSWWIFGFESATGPR